MKLLLKAFQTDKVEQLVKQLRFASREARSGSPQSICLSSPTGSGKTVMVTAAIEAFLKGDEQAAPEPNATFLWITDQPELNEQTRRKMLETSSLLTPDRLVVVDNSFDQETFRPGILHFLNIQKLGKEKSLVTPGDKRAFTIWETVTNTITRSCGLFFVIIDEAHRGMKETARSRSEATTIIQKFIKGSPGEIPPVPLVFGVSATPERFNQLVRGIGITNRAVEVSPEEVRSSGLIKEVLTLYHQQDSKQPSDMTMLREAVRSWLRSTENWANYCRANEEPMVCPILVIQVQDGTMAVLTKTDLDEAIRVIREVAGSLEFTAIAHSFQGGKSIKVGAGEIRYLAPPDVQNDPAVRVVFFKTSLNTGWDCPRAEVMMSFRTAADATYIAQLVGRMVRTPLARRIDSNETLNTVSLYLPYYDRAGLKRVIDRLTAPDAEIMPPVDVKLGEEQLVLKKAEGSEAIFCALEALPSYIVPKSKKSSEVRRLMKFSRLLANDGIDQGALDTATKEVLDVLDEQLNRLESTALFRQLIEKRGKVEIRAVNLAVGTETLNEGESIELTISSENLDDLFDAVGRKLGEGLHKAWWRRRVQSHQTPPERAKLETIALCFLEEEVLRRVETKAQNFVHKWLDQHRAAIKDLVEGRRQEYDEIRRLASQPETTNLKYPEEIETRTSEKVLKKHIYVTPANSYPCQLNSWEFKVINAEIDQVDVVGWLRNLPKKPWSLCIPYQISGECRPFFPDFLVMRLDRGQVTVDILDPHLISFEDAPAKAAGLANFATNHGHEFGRIQLIVAEGENLRRLDLSNEQVRNKVKQVSSNEHLRQLYELCGTDYRTVP